MSVCIDKLPHSCGTRRGLQVFAHEDTGKVDGFCFSCKTFVSNPYGKPKTVDDVDIPEPKSDEQIQKELAEVPGLPVVDVAARKLRTSDLDRFNVKVALSEEDGKTPYSLYFPITKGGNKPTGYYIKTLSKPSHCWSIGEVKGGDLFGWDQAKKSGAYKLIITEGLVDAVSVDKIYRRYGKEEYHPAIVSLPNGTNSVNKSLSKHVDDIKRLFKEVILCFDDDKVGQEAVQEAMLILPNAKSVTLPDKDANDCVVNGSMSAAYKALNFQAIKPKNTRLIYGQDLHQAAREPTPWGELSWPYPTMNELLRGIRLGETIYIGAGVKQGKSELVNDLAAHFIRSGVGVFMAKPEEANKKTYKMVCGKIAGKVFHDPKIEFDYEAFDRAGEEVKDNLMMIDLYQHMGWESLKGDIIAAAHNGAKAIFIDPITNLTSGMNSGDANTKLQEIAVELSSMAKDLNIVVFVFCHLKAPEGNISKDARTKKYREGSYVGLGNCPHEHGGDVLSNQFAGSRAMMRSCNLMIGLEGNRDKDLPIEIRNTRWLTILEDREFGNSESVKLFWDKNTTKFSEI